MFTILISGRSVGYGALTVALLAFTACHSQPKIDVAEASKTISDKVGSVQQEST